MTLNNNNVVNIWEYKTQNRVQLISLYNNHTVILIRELLSNIH